MHLTVDPAIFQRRASGGISRIFYETLPRLCELDSQLRITLQIDDQQGALKQALPEHQHISITHQFASLTMPYQPWNRASRRVQRYLKTISQRRSIWHSTYYTLPREWFGKQVITVYDLIYLRFASLYHLPEHEQFRQHQQRCIQQADAVICISETTRRDVEQFYAIDPSRLHVVLPAVSESFRVLPREDHISLPVSEPFIFYVSGRGPHKNFDALLQAYSQWEKKDDIVLVVTGVPWRAHEEKRLVELGIRDRVYQIDGVDDTMLCQLYNQATAFVYPSLYEGFGISLLEALSCGCPVVASRIPTSLEITETDVVYFEPSDVRSLVSALEKAVCEGRESERIQVGFKTAQSFSWDRAAAETLAIYHALV